MSQHNNPNAISTGLAFAYDQANPKSYKGPAVKNFLTQIEPRGISDNGTTYRFFSGTEQVYIPEVGTLTSAYVDMYNDYNGGSNNCCPSPYGYGQGLTVTGNTQYTYAILYKSYNRYTNPNWMYHYEYGPNGYITEYGVHMVGGYSGQETHLGDGWYWSRAIFTTNPNCNTLYTGSWMYQYATWNRFYVAKVALLEGNWLDLHPKYWPTLGTTRSNTNNLIDLTGQNTITATSLTYAGDGTFSWASGVDARIQAPSSSNFSFGTSDFTLECWIKPDNFNNYVHMIALPDQNTFALKANTSDGAIYFYSPSFTTYPTSGWTLVAATWNHVVMTRASSTSYSYLNGSLKGSKAGFTNNFTAQTLNIGNGYSGEYTAKSIGSVKIYNRALSSQEVQQNFAAQRGRYGI